MVEVVYIDVLFAVNLVLNFLMLRATSAVLHRQDKRLRQFMGAVLGALYSLFIFFPQVNFLYSVLLKVVVSVAIVSVSFKFVTIRNLLKLVAVFYGISFLFGGIIFALYFFVAPQGLAMRNGVVYFDISPVVLIVSGGACYVIITLISRLVRRSNRLREIYRVRVDADGRSAEINAFLDTGNSLSDTITGVPVMIAEYEAVKGLLPQDMRETFKNGVIKNSADMASSTWAGRFRMIPYGSVGATGGLLPAFKPDRLIISQKEKALQITSLLIAVTGRRLCADGSFGALIGPGIYDDARPTEGEIIHT